MFYPDVKMYIDIYNSLHIFGVTNTYNHSNGLVSLIEVGDDDYPKFDPELVLRNVVDVAIWSSHDLVLMTNRKLYEYHNQKMRFIFDNVKEIGTVQNFGYFLTHDHNLYLLDRSSFSVSFIASGVKKVQGYHSGLESLFYLTFAGAVYQYRREQEIEDPEIGSDEFSWSHRRWVRTGVYDFAVYDDTFFLANKEQKVYIHPIEQSTNSGKPPGIVGSCAVKYFTHSVSQKSTLKVVSIGTHNGDHVIGISDQNQAFRLRVHSNLAHKFTENFRDIYVSEYDEYYVICNPILTEPI